MTFVPRRPASPSNGTPDTPASLHGARLRSMAFALLAKREHSRQELYDKLVQLGAVPDELEPLLDELSNANYQSNERMAGMLVRANLRKGRGPARIQQQLKKHHIDSDLATKDLQQVNWLQQAISLRQRKFGEDLPVDQKDKARQLRFLQYRGFALDICLKAIGQQAMDD